MVQQAEIGAVEHLVLARLLAGGDKGASRSDLKKALEPLVKHRWEGSALEERLDQALGDTASAGLIERTRKARSKTERISLTPEGRRLRELARVSSYDPTRGNYVLEPVGPVPMEVEHA